MLVGEKIPSTAVKVMKREPLSLLILARGSEVCSQGVSCAHEHL